MSCDRWNGYGGSFGIQAEVDAAMASVPPGTPPEDYRVLVCLRRDDPVYEAVLVFTAEAAAELLALHAYDDLVATRPVVGSAPPAGGVVPVGLDVWFWAEGVSALSASASIPGLTSTVTATPTSLRVLADGVEIASCEGVGIAWSRAGKRRDREAACTHVFQTKGERAVTVEVVWSVAWTATNGQVGGLDDLVSETAVDLPVSGFQVVTD